MGINTLNEKTTTDRDIKAETAELMKHLPNAAHDIITKLINENIRLRWKTKNQKKELRSLNRSVQAASFFKRKYEDLVTDLKSKSGEAQVTPQSTVGVTKG